MPIGVIGRAHGLRGELRVHLHNPESEALYVVDEVIVEQPGKERFQRALLGAQPHGKFVLVALAGVASRDAAEALKGASVLVPRSALPPPDDDEYYDSDLIGLDVRSADGARVGRVVGVEHPAASDILILELRDGRHTDVPFREPYVLGVDMDASSVEIDRLGELPTRGRR